MEEISLIIFNKVEEEGDEKAQPEEDDLVLHVVEVDRLRRKIIEILCND